MLASKDGVVTLVGYYGSGKTYVEAVTTLVNMFYHNGERQGSIHDRQRDRRSRREGGLGIQPPVLGHIAATETGNYDSVLTAYKT